MAANASAPASAADLLDGILRERHSCRGFLQKPVPEHVILQILRIAQRTPSWCNAQPWQVAITTAQGTERLRGELSQRALARDFQPDLPFPDQYEGVYRERRRECAAQLYSSVGISFGDREASGRQASENFRFFGAPHLAVVTTSRKLGVYGAVDCGAYVNTFLLAAASLGVAAIAQAAIATQSTFLRNELGLGDDRLVVCGISFGYEDVAHPANSFRTSRASSDEVVQWVRQ